MVTGTNNNETRERQTHTHAHTYLWVCARVYLYTYTFLPSLTYSKHMLSISSADVHVIVHSPMFSNQMFPEERLQLCKVHWYSFHLCLFRRANPISDPELLKVFAESASALPTDHSQETAQMHCVFHTVTNTFFVIYYTMCNTSNAVLEMVLIPNISDSQ